MKTKNHLKSFLFIKNLAKETPSLEKEALDELRKDCY